MPVPKLVATAVLMAANVAMTALQTTEGPRLTDTRATVADYGTPSNNFIGTRILPAHCTFAKPIEEKRKKRKGKGGKQVTYTGYGTFMAQVAEHQIDQVLQIYMDNHLVYDATGSSEKLYPLADDYELASSMRFMFGALDQEPDPDMLAYIEARDGPGTCPAYRDQANIYFERIPLENFGNRLPDVKVLASVGVGTTGSPLVEFDFKNGDYAIGGVSKTLAEVVEAGPYGTFDPAQVVPGIGYVQTIVSAPPYTTQSVALLTAEAYAALGEEGFTAVIEFNVDAQNPAGGDAFARIDVGTGTIGPGISPFVELTAGARDGPGLPSYAILAEGSVVILATVADPLAVGAHRIAITLAADAVHGAIDGSSTVTGVPSIFRTGMVALNLYALADAGNTATAAISRITFYPKVTGSALTALSLADPAESGGGGGGGGVTLATLLNRVAARAGLSPEEYDFSLVEGEGYTIPGYSWTQGTGQQIAEPVCDLFDVDLRPHDFVLQALPRGGASGGTIEYGELVANDADDSWPFRLTPKAEEDLPRRVFLTYSDTSSGQEPNTAMPVGGPDRGASGSRGEASIDMTPLALDPAAAQQLIERRQRRLRFGRLSAEFGLTRRRIALEPGDVWSPALPDEGTVMRCTKLTMDADGVIATEWERDDPRLAVLPGSEGALAAGYVVPLIPTSVDTAGAIMDLPLLIDAHDQSAPFIHLAAGPSMPGVWQGADVAASDTGDPDSFIENWDAVASGDGAVIGTCDNALPDVLPWVPDLGSSLTVSINTGVLTAATLDDLLTDPTRNLAAIRSASGWELVQFMTPTLVAPQQYTLSGFLRGMRGTEWAMAGHAPGDPFVLLDGTVKRHTLGASEIGDTDYYVISTTAQAVDEAAAEPLTFGAATHRPLAPVYGYAEQSGTDWLFNATRRTRIGSATLDGQDVPLGEASESWELDILDGATVVRTIAGASLPLTYLETDQATDFGSPLGAAPSARLYQIDPVLNLRGYPLAL